MNGPGSPGSRAARWLLGALVSALLLAGLVGCTGSAGVVAVSSPPWWEPHVTVDGDLRALGLRKLTFTTTRTGSGFLRVVGEYFNQSQLKLSTLYRFTWLDAAGQPVDSILGDWQAVNTLPQARATFAGIAPRDDIENFRVELMSAHRLKGQPRPSRPER